MSRPSDGCCRPIWCCDVWLDGYQKTEAFTNSEVYELSNVVISNSAYKQKEYYELNNNTDLHFIGFVDDKIAGISVVDADGKIVAVASGINTGQYSTITNLPKGQYTLQANLPNSKQQPIYAVRVIATPSVPELDLPRNTNTREISLVNTQNNALHIMFGNKQYTLEPAEVLEITLEEGENTLRYFTSSIHGKSDIIDASIFCDSMSPVITLTEATYFDDAGTLLIHGEISEYAELKINGEYVMVDGHQNDNKTVTFSHYIYNGIPDVLVIEAIDMFGNNYTSKVVLR